jgi:hypothetical protein
MFCPSIFDHDISAFGIAGLAQTLLEGGQAVNFVEIPRRAAQKSDHRYCWLLRLRGKRPRRRCAAEQGDELAPSHELPSEEARDLSTSLDDEGAVHRSEIFPLMSVRGQILTPRSAPTCLLPPNADIALLAGRPIASTIFWPGRRQRGAG